MSLNGWLKTSLGNMCVTPVTIHKGTPDQMTVGCGRCIPCHIKYCNQWAFRFKLHANTAVTHYCVTLTYAGEHLPKMRVYSEKHKQGKVFMTLRRSHASSFFKTLRNQLLHVSFARTSKTFLLPDSIVLVS